MARGGVTTLGRWVLQRAALGLWLVAPAAAADPSDRADLGAEHRSVFHASTELPVLPRGVAQGLSGFPARALPAPLAQPFAVRRGAAPARTLELAGPRIGLEGGAPLYGVLAGRALLSTLHLRGDLPGHAAPWIDGDATHVMAGFEFSF